MKCQFCSSPAAVHITDIVAKKKHEMHLCEACAREKNLLPQGTGDLNVPAILQLVLGQLPRSVRPGLAESSCPACGTPYAHFKAQGRLGCPHDYEVFRPLLQPILEQVHNGSVRHVGKLPARHRRRLEQARRVELEAKLRLAVEAENYEAAALLRDAIRSLGAAHES